MSHDPETIREFTYQELENLVDEAEGVVV